MGAQQRIATCLYLRIPIIVCTYYTFLYLSTYLPTYLPIGPNETQCVPTGFRILSAKGTVLFFEETTKDFEIKNGRKYIRAAIDYR